jgi:chromate transporter
MELLTLFLEFFKIGLFSFGGGYGMLPLMEETVVGRGWLTESRFFDFVGVAESTPGPIAINMATFIGTSQGGFFGAVLATLGVVLPSFMIIVLIAAVLKNLTGNRFFAGFMKGVKPVVTGLILTTGLLLLLRSATPAEGAAQKIRWFALVVFGIVALVCWLSQKFRKKKLTAVPVIFLSAAIGIIATVMRQI